MSAFIVPASKAKRKANRFAFRLPGEKADRTLPRIQDLRGDYKARLAEIARASADVDSEDKEAKARLNLDQSILTTDILEEECPGLLKQLTGDQLDALLAAWRDFSGVTEGESSAS